MGGPLAFYELKVRLAGCWPRIRGDFGGVVVTSQLPPHGPRGTALDARVASRIDSPDYYLNRGGQGVDALVFNVATSYADGTSCVVQVVITTCEERADGSYNVAFKGAVSPRLVMTTYDTVRRILERCGLAVRARPATLRMSHVMGKLCMDAPIIKGSIRALIKQKRLTTTARRTEQHSRNGFDTVRVQVLDRSVSVAERNGTFVVLQGSSPTAILNTIHEAFEYLTTATPDVFADPAAVPTTYGISRCVAAELFVCDALRLAWPRLTDPIDTLMKPAVRQKIEAAVRGNLTFFTGLMRDLAHNKFTPPPLV
jgi:hypothetical protein